MIIDASNRITVQPEPCACRYEKDWGVILCPAHFSQRIAEMEEPIKIGTDGLCQCNCGMTCPLGKTGSALRCTRQQLRDAGVPTVGDEGP